MEGLGSVVLCGVVPAFGLGEHERGERIAEEAHLPRVGMSAKGEWDIGFWDDLSSPMRWVVRQQYLQFLAFRQRGPRKIC